MNISCNIPSFWQWQETSEAEQVKRFISAKTAECTPVSIDKVNNVGVFSGKHGIYNVFPDRCECFDFAQRGKPCKHIYRFAMELGVLQTEDVKSDLSRVQLPAELKKKMLERVIDCLEGYPEVLQREIMDVLYKAMYRADKSEPYVTDSPTFFNAAIADHLVETAIDYKKLIGARPQKATVDPLIEMGFSFPAEVEKNKKARFEWCLEHAEEIGPLVFPQMVYIVPSGELSAVKSKVYTYLCRKYRDVEYYDENMNQILIPYGAEEMFFRGADGRKKVHLSFPDDEITALLDKHGTNRCRNID